MSISLSDWLAILSCLCFGGAALHEIRLIGLHINELDVRTHNRKKLLVGLGIQVVLIFGGIILFVISVATRP